MGRWACGQAQGRWTRNVDGRRQTTGAHSDAEDLNAHTRCDTITVAAQRKQCKQVRPVTWQRRKIKLIYCRAVSLARRAPTIYLIRGMAAIAVEVGGGGWCRLSRKLLRDGGSMCEPVQMFRVVIAVILVFATRQT